ncbi:hypothetical protein PENANT_c028G06050 [Penicillium antarcticum]|uniref:Helicase ATP-binding domain-containing protein n=1 Tax=Penicillium antarcticum TaxID=416450 RepID=A0A1V6PW92_9EURO|nr:hypothetical protein PENANT_c028G06050 [Penicillium antarcticum]
MYLTTGSRRVLPKCEDDVMDHRRLSRWYNTLPSRIVDLVGDFAGDELFVIEGDSLLLHCFSNDKLDFFKGFQPLHATYLVEKLMQKLQHRNFYSDGFTDYFTKSGAYLFMCHDGAFARSEEDEIGEDDSDEEDSNDNDSDKNDSEEEDSRDANESGNETATISRNCHHQASQICSHEVTSKIKLRMMIRWLIAHGHNIALINNLVFRDTKAMVMVIEGSRKRMKQTNSPLVSQKASPIPERQTHLDAAFESPVKKEIPPNDPKMEHQHIVAVPDLEPGSHDNKEIPSVNTIDREMLEKVICTKSELTQSQCLMVVALCIMLRDADAHVSVRPIEAQSMILHLVLLQNIKLTDRAIRNASQRCVPFFDDFLRTASALLSSVSWEATVAKHNSICDLSDFVDERLFFETWMMMNSLGAKKAISPLVERQYNTLASLVDCFCGTTLNCMSTETLQANTESTASSGSIALATVLPFEDPVFNAHLQPVRLLVDKSFDSSDEPGIARTFKDHTHWHSSRTLDRKAKMTLPPKVVRRGLRKNQFFMAEMMDYAESLSGSAGLLKPETVVVEAPSTLQQTSNLKKSHGARYSPSLKSKKCKPSSGTPSIREVAAATIRQKQDRDAQSHRQRWKNKQQEFGQIADLPSRFLRVNEYLYSLPDATRQTLAAEVLMYALDTLVRLIIAEFKGKHGNEHISIATRAWEIIARLTKLKQGVSAEIVTHVGAVCKLFQLPLPHLQVQNQDSLSFVVSKPSNLFSDVSVGMSPAEFQLLYGGPFMDRGMDSLPDIRTPDFEPDRWQRDVLDQIDAKKSVLVVAPTSAGKTFISFYAMRQILKEDNEGILVYVAPTKALVNQIAAEVQARFSKSYPSKTSGKSVWAIHTRDYRINEPMGCQILVTVPHILQIMLLAPSNANAWTPRIKRIIFDEIHCIGQANDGVVWEQLLLLAPCPIIALSATVGNPQEFYSWLHRAQGTNGFDLKIIQHKQRYSDLRKYVYRPRNFMFTGFSKCQSLPRLGLDEAEDMEFVHPVTSLLDRSRGMPEDLDLEPRDCLTLWKAMRDVQTNYFPVHHSLDPSVIFLNIIIQKKHVLEWQKKLKALLGEWMKDPNSPFELLLYRLGQKDSQPSEAGVDLLHNPPGLPHTFCRDDPGLLDTTLPLIFSLHSQGALPALFFNYDRAQCEDICHNLLNQLQYSENEWKDNSLTWKTKIEKWNKWKFSKEQADKKTSKSMKKKSNGDDQWSREDQIRESASAEHSHFESFDPERPVDGFHLANYKMLPSEFPSYVRELRRLETQEWLIEALERGIGVHHAGMNRKYRYVCEILFRRGFLRVVIATGTLALGINMPCKTVVFSGDSIFLTALNFRQAAGRAGRRGFDLLGNVVFQLVPTSKVKRLISSRLPDLNGHFPITTSLVLRLFILLQGSNRSASAVRSINSLLSAPRIYLGGPEMKETVLHHLRFSIEYLRRNGLLDRNGSPLNFAGIISHLYHTETASFAFHALLRAGYFHRLCKNLSTDTKGTLRNLMLVMSHLFGRHPLRLSTLESYKSSEKKASSIVVLPPLPKRAAAVLAAHNDQVLKIYTGYVTSFINQHVKGEDCQLPFSGIKCGGDQSAAVLGLSKANRITTMVTSPFFALSGHEDNWNSISDLCETVRSGVWLEESVIPYLCASGPEYSTPLNAYLLDFFKHGSVRQLETANHIRRGDIWFALNDFSLILATINTSLENFISPRGNMDTDMLNVVGGGDAHEMSVDGQYFDEETSKQQETERQQPGETEREEAEPRVPIAKYKAKATVENWEEEMDEDSEDSQIKHRSPRSLKKEAKPKAQKEEISDKSMVLVARGFRMLQDEFDRKFREMWA